MRRTEWLRALVVALAAVSLGSGCQDQDFVGQDGFYALAMTEATPPYVAAEDATLYLVERRIELPVREPPQEEIRRLRQEARGQELPFDRLPWVERGDYEIEIDWSLSNLEDRAVSVDIVINGFNEFHEFVPTVIVDDEDVIPRFSQWERSLRLEPFERRRGTIREAELDEAAVDLATVANGAPNADQVMHPQNHSSTDRRVQPFIPSVIPALTGVRLGLRAEGASNLVLEATVRARDVADRLTSQNDAWELPQPALIMPAAEEE
jgi:hypothetical protein